MNGPVCRGMAECNGCPVAPGAASKCLKCDGGDGEQSVRAHVGGCEEYTGYSVTKKW